MESAFNKILKILLADNAFKSCYGCFKKAASSCNAFENTLEWAHNTNSSLL